MQQLLFNWHRADLLPLRCLGAAVGRAPPEAGRSSTGSWPSPAAWTSATAAGMTGATRRAPRCAATRGRDPHGPYHDVQAVLTGPVVGRWWSCSRRGGSTPGRPAEAAGARGARRRGGGGHAATAPRARGAQPHLWQDAGALARSACRRSARSTWTPSQSAERLIYFENQYFSSRAIFQALVRRMRDRRGAGFRCSSSCPAARGAARAAGHGRGPGADAARAAARGPREGPRAGRVLLGVSPPRTDRTCSPISTRS